MNREIKFRAWSNLEKKMIQNPPLRYSYGKWIIEYADTIMTDIILSQFTGLLDKNGKEIYDGDIVKVGEENIIVTFEDGCFSLIGTEHSGILFDYDYIVKIGNIYENPELIK